MPKPTNNIELVANLMAFSPSGAMAQLFIMEAIRRYAEQCATAPVAAMESKMVNGAAWKRCAQDILMRVEAFYSRHDKPTTPAGLQWRIMPAGAHVASRNGEDVGNVWTNWAGQIEAYPWATGLSSRGIVTSFEAGRMYVEQALSKTALR